MSHDRLDFEGYGGADTTQSVKCCRPVEEDKALLMERSYLSDLKEYVERKYNYVENSSVNDRRSSDTGSYAPEVRPFQGSIPFSINAER